MEQLLDAAINENFVPVVDDRNVFIGIVRRNAILEYFREKVHESRALQQREVVGAAWWSVYETKMPVRNFLAGIFLAK